ncbi:hypothetical protein EDB89DRAFT_2113355 [Lactarius sanguifluus]|nr:hypothetical protein EDB89DRAFT_2113355 [Lactarius sanguifluus]
MSQVQIHCRGCNWAFTPQGLSQHINRTQLLSCRALRAAIQLPAAHQTQGSNLASNTGPASWDHDEFANEDTAAEFEDTATEYEDAAAVAAADTSDPADTADADLLEILVQDYGPAWPLHSKPSDANGPQLVINHFPHGSPGATIPGTLQGSHVYQSSQETFGSLVWAPFYSQCDWEIMRWAKMHRPTLSAVTDILAIPKVVDKLSLSYHMPNELNKIIDKELPGHPQFKCEDMTITGNTLQFYFRDVLECIRTLYGNPEFARDLVFVPECHYTDHERKCHVYSEMHTGDWWWAVQTSLEAHRPGAMVILVILSSDKTQLTLFRGKAAYPVYLMIGNVSKDIRRKLSRCAQMLISYIPTAHLEGIGNKTARHHALANLFHFCIGDGVWRWCHPIFATFIGDYPKQVLVTCTFNSQCPKCVTPLRDYDKASEAFLLADGDIRTFHSVCRKAGLKPVFHPFWEALPLTNVFVSITPDILHQMLQGVMKHLTFVKGISTLSRVSGLKHKQMCQILLIPARFHDNKDVFVDLGTHNHFIIPKVHSLLHYKSSITLFSSTDNYNAEQTERLHINFTKDAYHVTNRKDEYPQMTAWLEWREKIQQHMKFIAWWQQAQHDSTQHSEPIGPSKPVPWTIQMARNLSLKAITFNDLADKYRAFNFQDALADFIAQLNHPQASATALRALAEDTLLPFRHVPVFHKIKFLSMPNPEVIDIVHVWPDQRDARGRTIPSHFDTVIICGRSQDSAHMNKGLRIAQVRVVFQLPGKVLPQLFPSVDIALPTHLAYVEWFSPIPTMPDSNSRLYRVSSIIPVDNIYASVHLLPHFGQLEDTPGCNTFSVLELCPSFYINPFSS